MSEKKNPYELETDSCSTTDSTGLIPAAPRNKDERDAYNSVYNYSPPDFDNENIKDKQDRIHKE